MEYFCAKCKKKHQVTDIAVDLWNICADQVRINASKLLSTLESDDDLDDLNTNLTGFLGNQEDSGKMFLFKGSEIRDLLQDLSVEGDVYTGVFTLKMWWLIENYKKSIQGTAYTELPQKCEDMIRPLSDQIIFHQKLKFTFAKVGLEKEMMFKCVTDEHDDPFTDDSTGISQGYQRKCPHCGGKLSSAVGYAQEIVIALSGAPRAGKTSCLTAVVSALSGYKFRGLSMEIPNNDPLWQKLALEVDKFNHSIKVEKTPMDLSDVPAYSFLVHVGNEKRVMTFVDMPGEFWMGTHGLSKDFHTKYMGLYRNIDCMWLFISKPTVHEEALSSDTVRTQEIIRKTGDMSASELSNTHSAALTLAHNLGSLCGYLTSLGEKVPPVAVVMTKAEADLGDEQEIRERGIFPINTNSPVNEWNQRDMSKVIPLVNGTFCLNEHEYYKRSNSIREYLGSKNHVLLQQIENHVRNRTYIAMAAYGHPAKDPVIGQRPAINPPEAFRELFPLVWTLAITGTIPVLHGVVKIKKNIFGSITSKEEASQSWRFDYRFMPQSNNKKENMRQQSIWCDISKNLLSATSVYHSTQVKAD